MIVENISITSIAGFRFGNAGDSEAGTGCTVIVSEDGAVCGVDVRGGSPGTRDTDALSPLSARKVVHAVLLTGGSAFGLAAADGATRFLEERRIGRDVGITVVPNVCAAVLFDLKPGKPHPDAAMGYSACEAAFREDAFLRGQTGAGTGATVGKARDIGHCMKGGLGWAAFRIGKLTAGAVAAVNSIGDIVENGSIIAGTLADDGSFANGEETILENYAGRRDFFSGKPESGGGREGMNTTLVCIVTNARLDKADATRLAGAGHDGIARVIRPAHLLYDGDTVFALASGEIDTAPDAVGILARRAVESAIISAVKPPGESKHR
ncbi:MAG: P1 family peptidase [Spirochaetaceae bacterium]|jgi:L-aminopeptidase/D-esterase-like protein|nr:P1 family peptidase [Spirochaetaceae bacterium]